MKREEWKKQYGAARLLSVAFISRNSKRYNMTPTRKLTSELAYQAIKENLHPSVWYALGETGAPYPLKSNKWAIKHNSTAFDRKHCSKTVLREVRL